MQEHCTTPHDVRQDVVRAVALYSLRHGVRRHLTGLPHKYVPQHRHDTGGHADEDIFLAALAAHPDVGHLERTTPAEDELLGVDALVTMRGESTAVPIDFTTRGRGVHGGVANLHDTLRRGIIPVVMEEVPTDLVPAAAYAAFSGWRAKGEEFLAAAAHCRNGYAYAVPDCVPASH